MASEPSSNGLAISIICVSSAMLLLCTIRYHRQQSAFHSSKTVKKKITRTNFSKQDLLDIRDSHTCPSQKLSHQPNPLCIVRGDGAYLVDEAGNRYLDSRNNVASIGHQHPKWVAAICDQISKTNTNARYLHPIREEFCSKLLSTFPNHLTHVFLVNSGSEANDLALRLARAKTKRTHVIAVENGYHGITLATLNASPYKWKDSSPPGTRVIKTPSFDTWNEIDQAVSEIPPAALIVESALSVAGCVLPPKGWLTHAFDMVHLAGGVCIADEIQVGLGRLGDAFWGFARDANCRPDIVTIGKGKPKNSGGMKISYAYFCFQGLGNGFPIGAVVCTRDIAMALTNENRELFSTFGGK